MSSLQLTNGQLSASLFSYWNDNFPLSVATVFPGTKLGTAELEEWIELWIQSWSRRAFREGASQIIDLAVTVHCFVKQQTDLSRIHQLVDAAQTTLAHAAVPIRNFDVSGNPLIGYATLFETDSHDLTRSDQDAGRHALQHMLVTCSGIAQPI
jgi:hypothetical protein